ncbi:MAG: hypothetical protein ACYCPH_02255 [Minisyncoccota bacterium]
MNTLKYFLLSGIATFFFISPLGVHFAMPLGPGGEMSGCPLMGTPALCHMSPFAHASALQNMFVAIPFAGIFAILIALLFALVAIPLIRANWKIGTFLKFVYAPPPQANASLPRNVLQKAFARGIIHSKAF